MRGIPDDVGQGARADGDERAAYARPHGLGCLLGRVDVGPEHEGRGAQLGRHPRAGDRLGVLVHHDQRRTRHLLREPLQRVLGDEDHWP